MAIKVCGGRHAVTGEGQGTVAASDGRFKNEVGG